MGRVLGRCSDGPFSSACDHHRVTSYLADGQLLVIETEDDAYLGTAQVDGDTLVVRSGYVGRPIVVAVTDVLRITVASDHPLVEDDVADPTFTARSLAPITAEHLTRMGRLAAADRAKFALRHPKYAGRHIATVLAQGGALHFVDGVNGVKDLDVWSFYSLMPGTRWPADRRNVSADFGPSSLGRQEYNLEAAGDDRERAAWKRLMAYEGRRVDLLMRALPVPVDADPVASIRDWLMAGAKAGHGSAWYLAKKAVVMIDPNPLLGEVIWP